MNNLYAKNGLAFWDAEEIKVRDMLTEQFSLAVQQNLSSQNAAFKFIRIEAPLLTPCDLIDVQYTADDIYKVADDLALRPETTMGSYQAARWLLTNHTKTKLPFCVWQLGKSFRREQDQPLTKMRLKEFYQMELQCFFSPTTAKDYAPELIICLKHNMECFLGECHVEHSDRLPKYADWTQDIVCDMNGMELASISKRKDFELGSNIEVAIGMDRCMRCFFLKNSMKLDVQGG